MIADILFLELTCKSILYKYQLLTENWMAGKSIMFHWLIEYQYLLWFQKCFPKKKTLSLFHRDPKQYIHGSLGVEKLILRQWRIKTIYHSCMTSENIHGPFVAVDFCIKVGFFLGRYKCFQKKTNKQMI